ncbi:MAG TPA: prepilin peptidase [Candidatus Hydrogenedentes bacterium]|nr:prepilin peptidase [Candidatus Hydrogenedentota bacterium]
MDENLQALNALLAVFSFVLGSMIGSFLNVCVYRLPRGLSVVKPRSKCPKCDNPIAWYDNIPVVSWLVLGAKCRHCGQPISWQYPLVEAITGVLFLVVFWRFGIAIATPIYMLLSAALVLVTFVDLTDWTIPDEVTLPGIPVGIATSVLFMLYPKSGLAVMGPFEMPVFNSLLGVVVGGGVLYALDKGALLLLKKPGMGFGDVKLNAMLGAFFGLYGAILIIVIAAFIGSFVGILMILAGKRNPAPGGPTEDSGEEPAGRPASGHYLPFGPYLALAGVIVMLAGPAIIGFYFNTLLAPPSL